MQPPSEAAWKTPSPELLESLAHTVAQVSAELAKLPEAQRNQVNALATRILERSLKVPHDIGLNAWQRRRNGGPAVRATAWRYGLALLHAAEQAGIGPGPNFN